MRMLAPLLLALQVAAAAGCADPVAPAGSDGPPAPREAVPSITDGAHGGEDGFSFLPPLVPEPSFDGTFDPGRSPAVEVCRLGDTTCGEVVATFTRETGPGSETVRVDTVAEQYVVNFHTDDFELADGAVYRIRVLLEGIEAGHADVVPVSSGKEMKSADTDETIALLDGRTLPIKFRIEEGLVLELTVPALPPDSVPTSLRHQIYADSNLTEVPGFTGRFPDDIVWVSFRPETSREARQEAIDLIDGEVVGGMPMGPGGIYVVRIPTEGSGERLAEAITALEGLPQVTLVSPDTNLLISGHYRRPGDGAGWEEGDWSLVGSASSNARWGLEAIGGPQAWGCGTGGEDPATVGVVDYGFQSVSDLAGNVAPGSDTGLTSGQDHGNAVASIIGAVGDNGEGMTGTMWQANLKLSDYRAQSLHPVSAYDPYALLARLAQSGIPVINFSSGFFWLEQEGRLPANTPSDSNTVRKIGDVMYQAVASSRFSGNPEPLVVISASNDGIDAWWSGTAQVADSSDVADRVLVVGAVEPGGNLASFSNRNVQNSLVEVAAPGVDVGALNASGAVGTVSGTSFAAPFVSGTAGLLASFDPRLDAAALESRILEGAAAGGRTAGGIPVLHAHESLKAVAEEPGAPLCGNRVWAADGSLHADRAGTARTLAPVVGSPIAQVEALHGGKFVRYLTIVDGQRTHRAVRWPGGSGEWTETSAAIAEPRGGTLLSVFGLSHEQDTVAVIDASDVSGTRWYETADTNEAPVFVQVPDAGSSEPVGRIPVRDFEEPVELTCIQRDADTEGCVGLVAESRFWFFRLGYPQFPSPDLGGRQATVTVSPMHYVRVDSTAWTTCSFDASLECRDVQFRQLQAGALAYRMDLASSGAEPVRLDSIADQSIFWAGQGEQGDELVLGRGEWRITLRAGGERFEATGNPFFDLQGGLLECVIEYRERVDFGALGSPVSSQDACFFTSFDRAATGSGGGTIAPDVTVSDAGPASAKGTPVALPMVRPTPAGLEAGGP